MKARLAATCVMFASLAAFILPGCQSIAANANFSNYRDIAELATIECYFHNVAEVKNDGQDYLFGAVKVGYKKAWFEYRGSVDLGIDVNKVVISQPDPNGVVTIAIPEPRVIGEAKIDNSSFSDVYADTDVFTQVVAQDQTEALAVAQEKMKEQAENDQDLLNEAKERAKTLLEQYVKNVGELQGKEYTVVFTGAE